MSEFGQGGCGQILKLPQPITAVTISNPYNISEFPKDKQTIVDVQAVDSLGRQIQVEVQLQSHPFLSERILYTWADRYSAQLVEGEEFDLLKPTYAIWVLRQRLTRLKSPQWHHRFELRESNSGEPLTNHQEIHLIELSKWQFHDHLDLEDAWVYFLKEASQWQQLPSQLRTPSFEAAMDVLKRFSQSQAEYQQYKARKHWQILQNTIQRDAERTRIALEQSEASLQKNQEELRLLQAQTEQEKSRAEQAQAQAEQAQAQAEQAQAQAQQEKARAARLEQQLRKLGIEPD